MLKIGEFSKMAHLTVKTLRFYEKEGILSPSYTDYRNGYRFYETSQLQTAAEIKSYRQLGLTIEEIKAILSGADKMLIFAAKEEILLAQKVELDARLSILHHILEGNEMKYRITTKEIPEQIVYYTEVCIRNYSDMMQLIPEIGEECRTLNPTLTCAVPPYEFCEYLDEEHMESDIRIRHNEAVTAFGKESDRIKFRTIPAVKVLSVLHKGPYDEIGEAYAYLIKYAEENDYTIAGLSRECYIDGIWNKENMDDWLTEIQLPIR